VLWALDRLRVRGYAEPRLDLAHAAHRALEAWREQPGVLTALELPEPAHASLLMGEAGILAVLWQLHPEDGTADDLHTHVRANVANSAHDVMWGAPGTMLAALAMLAQTKEDRWKRAWRESASALLEARDGEGLWTQQLHGEAYRGLGAAHGAVGNVLSLLQGAALLMSPQVDALRRETNDLLARTAVVEGGLANWPGAEGESLVAGDGQVRVQWDCGAPGVVASTATFLDEELLLAGAELTWQAGPHGDEKGSSLCHGTAGNGYALLSTFRRTQDERWLTRARRFAVHALDQVQRARVRRERGRYSLWTGDIGVALFAADCLEGRSTYPIMETWV
jgi:lantibiotic modifying enzyme